MQHAISLSAHQVSRHDADISACNTPQVWNGKASGAVAIFAANFRGRSSLARLAHFAHESHGANACF
eukprot:307724-Chlamydomonas_euryale.AAC.2